MIGAVQIIYYSNADDNPTLGTAFHTDPVVLSLDLTMFNKVSSGQSNPTPVMIFTFDKLFSRNKDFKHCAFKFTVSYAHEVSKKVSGQVIGSFETKKLLMVSKPSKKPSAKGMNPPFVSGSHVSIHNRINSQNSSTRFLSFTAEFEDGKPQDCKFKLTSLGNLPGLEIS